jgi:hypothetical protein
MRLPRPSPRTIILMTLIPWLLLLLALILTPGYLPSAALFVFLTIVILLAQSRELHHLIRAATGSLRNDRRRARIDLETHKAVEARIRQKIRQRSNNAHLHKP